MENVPISVSEAIELFNQSLEYAFPLVSIEGEVGSFKVNQNKFVFFDLKDDSSTLGCFMMVFALKVPLEDGMRIRVIAKPTITKWGKFSLTVQSILPVGEGSIKRAFELMKRSLEKEGLFDAARKRPLPPVPQKIGVVASVQSAGYADFIKIVQDRWPAVDIIVAPAKVQGMSAPTSVVNGLRALNEHAEPPDVIAIIRGGGSADDLAAFNDESLVRSVAASRIPVISGIGHEVDETLIDYVADVRAATPSNAAERIVPDRRSVIDRIDDRMATTHKQLRHDINTAAEQVTIDIVEIRRLLDENFDQLHQVFRQRVQLLEEYNPERILRRGYAIMRDSAGGSAVTSAEVGDTISIQTIEATLSAEVTHVKKRNN